MKIQFSKEVLNVMHTVRDYRRFLSSYHVMLLGDKQFDKDAEAEKFFYNLPITGGIPRSKAGYEAIMDYPQLMLDNLDKVAYEDLCSYEFGI